MKVSSEVVLPVPVERAWELLMRWEDQPRWMKDADSVRVLGTQREGVGTTIAVKTRVLNVPLFTERLQITIRAPPPRAGAAATCVAARWRARSAKVCGPGGARYGPFFS